MKDLLHLLESTQIECETILCLNASENHTSSDVRKIIGEHPSYDYYSFPPIGGAVKGP